MQLSCKYCEGRGEIEFSKERGGPDCPCCGGHGYLTRKVLAQVIGASLDHPSLYMGGASKRSLQQAERIIDALVAWGLEV